MLEISWQSDITAQKELVSKAERKKKKDRRGFVNQNQYSLLKPSIFPLMIGLKRGTIQLLPHDPAWAAVFQAERQRILNRITDPVVHISHIGSTAIRGIIAKPVIDVAISIEDYALGHACVEPLKELGYVYKGNNGIPDRHYFRTDAEVVKFHIHMFPVGNPKLRDHLLFRDYLNTNQEEAQRYDALKRGLMQQFPNDREAYTLGKSDLIQEILKRARADAKQ